MFTRKSLDVFAETIEDEKLRSDTQKRIGSIAFEDAKSALYIQALNLLNEEEYERFKGMPFAEAKDLLLQKCDKIGEDKLRPMIEAVNEDMQICASGALEEAFEGSAIDAISMWFYRELAKCLSPKEIAFFGGRELVDEALEMSAPEFPREEIPDDLIAAYSFSPEELKALMNSLKELRLSTENRDNEEG